MRGKVIRISVPIIAYKTWEIEYRNFPDDEQYGKELKKIYPERKDSEDSEVQA